jgi:hypothetical protein
MKREQQPLEEKMRETMPQETRVMMDAYEMLKHYEHVYPTPGYFQYIRNNYQNADIISGFAMPAWEDMLKIMREGGKRDSAPEKKLLAMNMKNAVFLLNPRQDKSSMASFTVARDRAFKFMEIEKRPRDVEYKLLTDKKLFGAETPRPYTFGNQRLDPSTEPELFTRITGFAETALAFCRIRVPNDVKAFVVFAKYGSAGVRMHSDRDYDSSRFDYIVSINFSGSARFGIFSGEGEKPPYQLNTTLQTGDILVFRAGMWHEAAPPAESEMPRLNATVRFAVPGKDCFGKRGEEYGKPMGMLNPRTKAGHREQQQRQQQQIKEGERQRERDQEDPSRQKAVEFLNSSFPAAHRVQVDSDSDSETPMTPVNRAGDEKPESESPKSEAGQRVEQPAQAEPNSPTYSPDREPNPQQKAGGGIQQQKGHQVEGDEVEGDPAEQRSTPLKKKEKDKTDEIK